MEEATSRLNIRHFQQMLRQPDLTVDRRKAIQALLSREEFNLDRLKRQKTIHPSRSARVAGSFID
jgi:hypothetical protein